MKATHFSAGVLLLFFFVHSSLELPLRDEFASLETEQRLPEPRKYSWPVKRHSDGAFSDDYNKYLEARVQDFLEWLMNSTKNGGVPVKRHADGTYTSDVSAYLQDQAAKNFISWLKSGQPKQDGPEKRAAQPIRRRHVDGTFTSDFNKVLDMMAAKEYIQRVMNPQTSGTSGKRA